VSRYSKPLKLNVIETQQNEQGVAATMDV